MRWQAAILALAFTANLGLPIVTRAQTADQDDEVGEEAKARIRQLIVDGADRGLGEAAIEVIDRLLETTRGDQDRIYSFARAINRNIDSLGACEGCVEFKERVREITGRLMTESYSDEIYQNANLTVQIKTRLPLLLEDSVKLNGQEAQYLRQDFEEELRIISERFLQSKRFRAGVGMVYAYLPSVSYIGVERLDFSPFQSTVMGGAESLSFNSEFANKSFASLVLSAEVPFLQIDAAFPAFEHEKSTITPVRLRDIDETPNEVLARSTISSKLDIDYDISIKASVSELIAHFRERPVISQVDWGIGIGITGSRIVDSISTDVRFRTDGSTPFEDLPMGSTLSSFNENSFNSHYMVGYFTFEINDEFQFGIDLRSYQRATSSSAEMNTDDLILSLSFIWFPTFAGG